MSETVKGKLSLGARIVKVDGVDKIFNNLFSVKEGEKLLKACQCYLSTTAGPIAGLLFISTDKVAFCGETSLKFYSSNGELLRLHYKGTFSVIAGLLCLGCGRMSFVNQMSRKNVVRQPKVLLWTYTWTAATRLPTAAYGALRDALTAKTSGEPRAPSVSIFDTYHLYFSGGPILTLASHGFLIPVAGVETVCFAFAPSALGLSVIGNVQQIGIQISIDEASGYIGFGPNVC
ncbi:hypothetical protein LWI29_003252 [Acer saccharum]|uniref:GRAM domain-containing protein n=1 Tax=Acer saccharum TaxID=4024 RepID=A0AA39VAI3_ACESA|nr:hypothetical protein LWI29_003252 [Acer saccharum]